MWCNWNTMGIAGWTMMVAFWAAVIWFAVWASRSTSRSHTSPTAMEILERRLAAGEIDPQEFEQRRHLIESGAASNRWFNRNNRP